MILFAKEYKDKRDIIKLYSYTKTKDRNQTYRISTVLKERVQPEFLSQAIHLCQKRFPSFYAHLENGFLGKRYRRKTYNSKPVDTRLTKHDIEQGTITISNLGSIYRNWDGVCTILEIITPQVVAIGISASRNMPICDNDGNISSGTKLPITIAFDHRALDMGDIVPFMKRLDEIFANPMVLKEWV